jgi:hypothetical protein
MSGSSTDGGLGCICIIYIGWRTITRYHCCKHNYVHICYRLWIFRHIIGWCKGVGPLTSYLHQEQELTLLSSYFR